MSYTNDTSTDLLNLVPLSQSGFVIFGLSFFLISLIFIIIFKSNISKAGFFIKLSLFSLVTLFLGLALCAFEPIIGIYTVSFSLIVFIMSVFITFVTVVLHRVSDVFIIIALTSLFIALVAQLFAILLIRNIAICVIALCIAIKTCMLIFKKETPNDNEIYPRNTSGNQNNHNQPNNSQPNNDQPNNDQPNNDQPNNDIANNNQPINSQSINSQPESSN